MPLGGNWVWAWHLAWFKSFDFFHFWTIPLVDALTFCNIGQNLWPWLQLNFSCFAINGKANMCKPALGIRIQRPLIPQFIQLTFNNFVIGFYNVLLSVFNQSKSLHLVVFLSYGSFFIASLLQHRYWVWYKQSHDFNKFLSVSWKLIFSTSCHTSIKASDLGNPPIATHFLIFCLF